MRGLEQEILLDTDCFAFPDTLLALVSTKRPTVLRSGR